MNTSSDDESEDENTADAPVATVTVAVYASLDVVDESSLPMAQSTQSTMLFVVLGVFRLS